ncbi:type-1 angiotensin II receptor-associated protein isoform X2 [Neocloeon triangulifer]|uniref:type-1 angiotensin II receptor-associated protein isoform X2 n=1 Tax=Neocloeon triangulifer TaxID=2078957 RepID=UPI00286F488A|nr:type-1 angiotensin II receptor-associated protein isoform X2 [Neocloeon triangulifer]
MIPQSSASNSTKVAFLIHLLFIAWGVQGIWSPDSYLFYNTFFLLTLLWGIHSADAEDPIQLSLCINILSIVLDIIVLSIYYPTFVSLIGSERFSVGMAIINLLLRPLSAFGLYRTLQDRVGSTNVNILPGGPNVLGNVFDESSRPLRGHGPEQRSTARGTAGSGRNC